MKRVQHETIVAWGRCNRKTVQYEKCGLWKSEECEKHESGKNSKTSIYLSIYLFIFSSCCTFFMLQVFSSGTLFLPHFLHVAIFLCCTLFMLLFFCVALFSWCFFVFQFFHVAISSCSTLFLLHSYARDFSEHIFWRNLWSDYLFFMCYVKTVI